MIKVSDTASKKIVDMMKDDGFDAAQDYVRVGVKSGGCSGLSYELKFDKEIGENDKVLGGGNPVFQKKSSGPLYILSKKELSSIRGRIYFFKAGQNCSLIYSYKNRLRFLLFERVDIKKLT